MKSPANILLFILAAGAILLAMVGQLEAASVAASCAFLWLLFGSDGDQGEDDDPEPIVMVRFIGEGVDETVNCDVGQISKALSICIGAGMYLYSHHTVVVDNGTLTYQVHVKPDPDFEEVDDESGE